MSVTCWALACARSDPSQPPAIPASVSPAPAASQPEPAPIRERVLAVRASAYNSVASQTDANPALAAWGDHLEPGMRAIAVSRDLLEFGLGRGSRVRIDGLPGEYQVLDKIARRWTRKIDIYMGEDVLAARQWGVQSVTIRWLPSAY